MTAKMPISGSPEKRRDCIAQPPLRSTSGVGSADLSRAFIQFRLPAMRAVIFFMLPGPRPSRTEAEAIGNLKEVTGGYPLGGWPPNTPLDLYYQFPCQISRDLVEVNVLVPFISK